MTSLRRRPPCFARIALAACLTAAVCVTLLASRPSQAACTGNFYVAVPFAPGVNCGLPPNTNWNIYDCATGTTNGQAYGCGLLPPPECTSECTLQTNPPPRDLCDPSLVGDPVMLGGVKENSYHRVGDFTVSTPAGPVDFYRTYYSLSSQVLSPASFTYGFVPKPFGHAMKNETELRWSHNFFSFIDLTHLAADPSDAGIVHVVTPGGYVDDFRGPLYAGNGWLVPTASNRGLEARLKYTVDQSGGWQHFYYYREDGWVFQYDSPLTNTSLPLKQYLTRAIDSEGRERFSVAYATPSAECPTVAAVEPYVSVVTLPAGPQLRFHYLDFQDAGTSCVLARIDAEAGGGVSTLASYTYEPFDWDGGWAPRLLSAQADLQETYGYFQEDGGPGFIVTRSGVPRLAHAASRDEAVRAVTDGTGAFSVVARTAGGPPCGSTCCASQQGLQRDVTWQGAGTGEGTATASLMQTFSHLPPSTAMLYTPAFVAREDSCSPSTACSAGTTVAEYRPVGGTSSCGSGPEPQTLHGTQDKRSSWVVTPTVAVDAGVPAQPFFERTAQLVGATTADGTGALVSTTQSYRYRPDPHLPNTLADQRLARESRPSAYAGADGGTADTWHQYDAASNRLTATIRGGYTRLLDGTWQYRYLGTFYKTARECEVPEADGPKQRTLRVEGPCVVSSSSATKCPGTSFPLTELHYHPDTPASYSAGQLAEVRRYPNGCAQGAALTRAFADYDAYGNAREVTDENGDGEALVYSGPRVVSRSKGGSTWLYEYEGDKLTRTTFPEGNVEVLCYRTGTYSGDCAGGALSDKLQWKAKAPSGWGALWTESVLYGYWPDGTVKEETYGWKSAPDAGSYDLRRSVFYASDAEKRPTLEKLGPQGGTAAALASARAYDGADNVVAIGQRYNEPPAFCRADAGILSEMCARMTYDRASRVAQLDESPASGTTVRTCIDYDGAGNVLRVSPGCSGTAACAINDAGVASTCTQAPNDYTHDDFGNVVGVTLANTEAPGGGRGETRFEFDAQGALVKKQTEAMRNGDVPGWVQYAVDMLGRTTTATHWTGATPTELYSLGYDAASAPSGCTAIARTKGRLAVSMDPVWQTYISYNAQGQVVAEVRLRRGLSACTGTSTDASPATLYAYSANGNLYSVKYPHGRTVVFGPDANNPDRVGSVWTTQWYGAWYAYYPLISSVVWEPYGGLRAYKVVNQSTWAALASVEYVGRGAASTAPAAQCPTMAQALANDDGTGRLRALWVTAGGAALESGAGDILKRSYTWKGDEVARIDTCYLGQATSQQENYGYNAGSPAGYDKMLRLKAVDRPNWWTTGGPQVGDGYSYDARSNRTVRTYCAGGACPTRETYATAPTQPDRLLKHERDAVGTDIAVNYAYDRDGRVKQLSSNLDSSGLPGKDVRFTYEYSGIGGAVPGTDSVFNTVRVNGAYWLYYYSARNERVRKESPLGTSDEYFWGPGHELLEDRGVKSSSNPQPALTEYVWLGGRPVVMWRGAFDANWVRTNDLTAGACERDGEAADCAPYAVLTDHLGKPVMVLDGAARVAGVGEYQAFGAVNRMPWWAETQHPYTPEYGATWVTYGFGQVTNAGMTYQVRAQLLLDTEPWNDYAVVTDLSGNPLTSWESGYHLGEKWTQWVTPRAQDGWQLGLLFWQFNSVNCAPDGSCWTTTWPYRGVTMAQHEYRRYQAGALPVFTPLRFPGHYFDTETELHQNWNRFFDPEKGSYLAQEPLQRAPMYLRQMAESGYGVPAYAYANNNPLAYVDFTGRDFVLNPFTRWFSPPAQVQRLEEAINALNSAECICAVTKGGGYNKPPWKERTIIVGYDASLEWTNFAGSTLGDFMWINPYLPTVELPGVLAHESGHTRWPYLGHIPPFNWWKERERFEIPEAHCASKADRRRPLTDEIHCPCD